MRSTFNIQSNQSCINRVSTVFIHLAAPAAIKSVTCLHINVSNVSQTFGVPDVSLSCLSSIYADVGFL